MKKEKSILLNYFLYFLCFLIVCFVGISNIFAVNISDSDFATKYYYYTANNSSSTTSTDYRSGSANKVTLYGATAPTYNNGEGFNGFYNRINYTISKGSIYTLSLNVSYNSLYSTEFGTANITNRLFSTDFAHCSNCTITAVSGSIRQYNSTNSAYTNLYDYVVSVSYTFVATSNASTWYIGSYTGDDRTIGIDNHMVTSIVLVSGLVISNDNSSTIINQNDTIINQNQQIIDQNNENTQEIINNQNQNTQDIIDSQKVCDNLNIEYQKGGSYGLLSYYLNDSGTLVSGSNQWYVSDYIGVSANETYNLYYSYNPGTSNYCLYDNNKNLLSCTRGSQGTTSIVPTQNGYIRFSLNLNLNNATTRFVGKVCKNGSQATTDAINGLNDKLTDDSPVDMSSLGNTAGWLPAGPIDSILTLPITMLNNFSLSLSGSCTALHITIPYTHDEVEIPCLSTIFGKINGLTTFWLWVGRIASVYILYHYLLALWDYYDRLTTMQVNFHDDFGGGV